MDDHERRELLGRIRKLSATVGKEVPDEITLQGETVDLNALVFELKALDAIPPAERERVEALKTDLQRERLQRKQRIERDEVAFEEGERLVETIHGIDRALRALEGLDEPDIGEQLRQKKLQDARELRSLIEQRPG